MAPDLQPWPHGPWTKAPPPQWVARPWASEGPPRYLRSSPLGFRMRHQLLQAQLGYMGRFMCIYVYIVVIYYIWWYMVIYYQICIWWYMMIYYISKSTWYKQTPVANLRCIMITDNFGTMSKNYKELWQLTMQTEQWGPFFYNFLTVGERL